MLFSKEEYKQRLSKVQKMMQEKGIELLISHDTNNMNYLTGYDAWSFYYAQCVIVHVNADEPICFVRDQDAGGAYIKTYVKKDLSNTDALFISCTALPVLSIIENLEKKMSKFILSSNQTLIWDTLKEIKFKGEVKGYGQLFKY